MDFFHWEYYRELNPDLYWQGYETQVQCTQHFKSHGIIEKRKYRFSELFPDFDWTEYKKQNPTLLLANQFAYEHHYFSIGRFDNLYYPVLKKVPVQIIKEIQLPSKIPEKPKLIEATVGIKPKVTVEPKVTIEPKVIVERKVTIEPKVTVEPKVGIQPKVTVEPKVTIEPKVTVEPKVGIQPKVIVEPKVTVEPKVQLDLKDKIKIQMIQTPNVKPKIGLFLTGWGEPYVQKKKEILLHNLGIIKSWKKDFELDLYIYLYTPSCIDVLRQIPFLDYVSNITIVPKPGIVGEFIYREVSKMYVKYQYIILFLDDIEFSPHCSLDKLISIYNKERIDILALPLTIDSPYNYSFMLQDINMIKQGYTYRETNFAELFFYLLSSNNFKNYLKFFTTSTKWCWGIDLTLYPNGIRIGIAETYPLKHYFKAVSYQKHLPDPLVEMNLVCGTKVKIKDKVNLRKEKY